MKQGNIFLYKITLAYYRENKTAKNASESQKWLIKCLLLRWQLNVKTTN